MNNKHIIKELRLRKGFTQAQLAEKTTLSLRTIQRIENNEVEATPYSLAKNGEALDVDLNTYRSSLMKQSTNNKPAWLGALHLSSVFGILWIAIIWIIFKKDNEVVDYHGRDILNFKINFLLIYMAFGLAFLLLLKVWALFVVALGVLYTIECIVTVYNAIRVSNKQDYQYPIFIKLFDQQV